MGTDNRILSRTLAKDIAFAAEYYGLTAGGTYVQADEGHGSSPFLRGDNHLKTNMASGRLKGFSDPFKREGVSDKKIGGDKLAVDHI